MRLDNFFETIGFYKYFVGLTKSLPPTWGLALLGHDLVTSSSATWQQLFGLDRILFGFLLLSSSSVFQSGPSSGRTFFKSPLQALSSGNATNISINEFIFILVVSCFILYLYHTTLKQKIGTTTKYIIAIYSDRRFFTGLVSAARIACVLTVSSAIPSAAPPAATGIHHCTDVR